jgi:hypothetical protein
VQGGEKRSAEHFPLEKAGGLCYNIIGADKNSSKKKNLKKRNSA